MAAASPSASAAAAAQPIAMSAPELERCRRLSHAIQQLDVTEMEELFKMLHHNGCHYTTNNNGVFLNLSRLGEDLLQQIERYIGFCNESRQNVSKYESLCQVLSSGVRGAGSDATAAEGARRRGSKPDAEPRSPLGMYRPPASAAGNAQGSQAAGGPGGAAQLPGAGGGPLKSRVSSSMKFYLLKKKYAKLGVAPTGLKDELEPDEPAIAGSAVGAAGQAPKRI